jgi:hypothetical protein
MHLHSQLTSTYSIDLLAESELLELLELRLDLLYESLSVDTTEEREKLLYPPVNTALDFKTAVQ